VGVALRCDVTSNPEDDDEIEAGSLLSTCRITCSMDEPRNTDPPNPPPCQALSSRQGDVAWGSGKTDWITASLTVADGRLLEQPVPNTARMKIKQVLDNEDMAAPGDMENHHPRSNILIGGRKSLRFSPSFVSINNLIFATMSRYGKNQPCFYQPLRKTPVRWPNSFYHWSAAT
jgi:hypothetical protein